MSMAQQPSSSSTSTSASSPIYKCTTCLISFETSDTHREHMRCDWHVYNLKRRIVSLPPVSVSIFEERVVSTSALLEEGGEEVSSTKETCDVCGKGFHTHQAYQSHLRGQNHIRNAAGQDITGTAVAQGDTLLDEISGMSLEKALQPDAARYRNAAATAALAAEEEEKDKEFDPSTCLFCLLPFSSMSTNLQHMQKVHGLFIRDPEYLIDTESFLNYLWTLITDFQECLYCSTTKSSVEAIRHHMLDKGHCKLSDFEPGCEWLLFYDYSSPDSGVEGDPIPADTETQTSSALTTWTTLHFPTQGPTPYPSVTANDDNVLHLPSGKTLRPRSQTPQRPQHHSHKPSPDPQPQNSSSSSSTALTPPESSASTRAPTTQLTLRNSDRLGLLGVPTAQQRALRAVEKMMLKRESRDRERYVAGVQRGGNAQKFFKNDVPGRSNG